MGENLGWCPIFTSGAPTCTFNIVFSETYVVCIDRGGITHSIYLCQYRWHSCHCLPFHRTRVLRRLRGGAVPTIAGWGGRPAQPVGQYPAEGPDQQPEQRSL